MMTYEFSRELEKLQAKLDSCNIQYFKAVELITGLNAGNSIPPLAMWENCIPVLYLLDQVREKTGRIRINSGYRSPEYNKKVKGSSKSYHKLFMAFDIKPLDCTLQELLTAIIKIIPPEKWGLRFYSTFIHIDCRETLYRAGF